MATKIENVDFQRMIDTAAAFFLAAERCVPPLKFGVYPEHSVSAPTIVNYALSVEIVLKILLRHYECDLPKGTNGHSIKKLSEALPENKRGFLEYEDEAINVLDTSFVDWRYPYEYDFLVISPKDFRSLFCKCYNEIRKLKPDLMCIYEKNWGQFEPDYSWAWHEEEIRGL
jgi:hypothetical protein